MCLALERIEACRENEKARESDLCKHRKQVKDDFLALGPGETDRHKSLSLDYMRTLLQIDYCRNRQSTLADQLGETIRNAHQPGLFGDDTDLEAIVSREPDEAELFRTLQKSKPDPDQQEFGDDTTPVGEPPKTVEIDEYLPGRFKDEDDQESNIYSLDDIRSIAAKRGNDVDIEIKPSSFGVSVYFMDKGKMVGKLDYCGKPKGRRKAG